MVVWTIEVVEGIESHTRVVAQGLTPYCDHFSLPRTSL